MRNIAAIAMITVVPERMTVRPEVRIVRSKRLVRRPAAPSLLA